MVLRHEREVADDIQSTYAAQIAAMTALHDVVMTMLTADNWSVKKRRETNYFVAMTMLGLLTKASKTFRSIQILCERGLHGEANALVRILAETTVAITFILQKNSKQRAVVFHAYGHAHGTKMLDGWSKTKGLRRTVPKELMQRYTAAMKHFTRALPPGTNFRQHWSGLRNFREAAAAVKADARYVSLYRFASSAIHGSDFGAQFSPDKLTGELVWEIDPTVKGFEAPSYAARELLWNAAHEVDAKLGLGFHAALAPHRLSKKDLRRGLG
jgi:uncharacterized protein DUF5677